MNPLFYAIRAEEPFDMIGKVTTDTGMRIWIGRMRVSRRDGNCVNHCDMFCFMSGTVGIGSNHTWSGVGWNPSHISGRCVAL